MYNKALSPKDIQCNVLCAESLKKIRTQIVNDNIELINNQLAKIKWGYQSFDTCKLRIPCDHIVHFGLVMDELLQHYRKAGWACSDDSINDLEPQIKFKNPK